jgi:filamentous hemagglutinin family protein
VAKTAIERAACWPAAHIQGYERPHGNGVRMPWRQWLAIVALASAFFVAPALEALAQSLPSGGSVAAGNATITQSSPTRMDINQTTDRAVVNWNSFSIGAGNTVAIKQPQANSVEVEQVVGQSPSNIFGTLRSNGQVVVANPNGIWFGPNSRVDVAGITATTARLSDQSVNSFMAGGPLNFDTPGNPNASVVNDGRITVAAAGLASLVAPGVANNGIIRARLGTVQLVSGDTFTLDLNGDGLVRLAVSDKVLQQALGPDGKPLGAAVSNAGTIAADGGSVYLTANVASDAVNHVIDMSGVVQARAAQQVGGQIVLSGGDDGTVAVSGTLDASGTGAGQTGGTVKVLGNQVALNTGTNINVSGDVGGGNVAVGGDFHGAGPDPNAQTTFVDQTAIINADAVTSGNGGWVAVWSNQATTFNGTITARGGSQSGNGGYVETSGAQLALGTGATVTASAAHGESGTWLLDPNNVTIQSSGSDTNVTSSPNFTTTNDTAILTVGSIQTALNAGTSVTVATASAGSDTQSGNITVANPSPRRGALRQRSRSMPPITSHSIPVPTSPRTRMR